MGIYDRDYVRREGPSFLGSFTERGRVCKWLVGINVLLFIVQVLTRTNPIDPGPFTRALDLNINAVLHGQIWRLLTHAFLHDPDTIWHILWNMLFLWWFGSDVEDLYGPREFLAFYLSGCLASAMLFFFSSLAWVHNAPPALGASGGVLAVLTLCAIHYPTRPILLMFILPVPLWMLLVIYVSRDAYAYLSHLESTPAVAGHLGGALFAGVYYRSHIRLLDWLPPVWDARFWQSCRRRLFGPRLRLYTDDTPPPRSRAPRGSERRPSPATRSHAEHSDEELGGKEHAVSAPVADEHLEAKMDAILEKISRVGKENLSESEREFLLRASEIFRRRRT
ncbi:MAG TPA: rhomboid family intramembrane serine protease [Gemmataceae bacterium]